MASSSNPIPRPPSRSERLLRDTLRKDDTLRTHGTHASSRPHSSSSNCGDDDDDDDFFQSAILFRSSSRRNSAASVLPHGYNTGFYIPDQTENATYSRLLRSSSYSGSSRSGRSHRRSSPRPAGIREKQDESSRHHDAAPHGAVLRNRLDSVMHSMRIDKDRDVEALTHAQSGTASLPSSLGSITNSRAHSHESHQTQFTIPDPDPCVPMASRPNRSSRGHRDSLSSTQPTSPRRPATPPRVVPTSPRSPRSPPGLRSPPRSPTSQEQLKRLHPDSPWMYAPLPPSPPPYTTSPSKRTGSAVVAFVASPPIVETHTHPVARSPVRHSPNSSSTFDPDAASHALKQLPGYVSFASVAGLGAPPEEEDKRAARRPFTNFSLGGGVSRLSGLGLGGGKWWMF